MFPTSLYFTPGFTEKREREYWGVTSPNYKNDYKCVEYLQYMYYRVKRTGREQFGEVI